MKNPSPEAAALRGLVRKPVVVDCPRRRAACKFWNEIYQVCSADRAPADTPCMRTAKQFQDEEAARGL